MAQMGRRSQSDRTKEGSVNRINSVYCMTIDANFNGNMTLKNPYKLIARIFLDLLMLSAIGNALTIFMIPGDLWSVKVVLTNCLFSIGIGYPAWKGMSYIVVVLERKLPWLQYPIKRLVSQVLSLTLFSGLIIFLGFTIWIKLSEGLDLESIFAMVLSSLKVVYIFVFLSLLLGNAILFFKNWKEATIQQEELKRAHLALQYQTLKDQVRPHFLFNSLSSLVTLINTDPEKATLFVHRLSDVYRYVLEQRENELVPVEEELKFLEDYVYLQQIRFGENLQVQYNLKLEPKRMVVTECGHAYRATVIEGPYWAGIEDGQTPIPSFHYVEWVAEALRTGKIKIDPDKRIKEPVTYQDSCNYIRNGGLADVAREIMGYIAEDFREMTPNREHNFCCGGGGGLNGIGRYRQQRNIGMKVKLKQIVDTGAKLVIAPCHNCWDAIRDLEEVYKAGIRWSFLKPLLINMAVIPEHLKPKDE